MSTIVNAKTSVWSYTVEGTNALRQTWAARGHVNAKFPEVLEEACRHAFLAVTAGKAQFGRPGVGCQGPYTINRVEVSRET